MTAGGFNNQPMYDNPTFEFFPPKFDGSQIYSKFLHDVCCYFRSVLRS